MLKPTYIKEVVKETRERMGMTQKDFAKLFGVGKNSVWQWEQGDNFPDDRLLPKLAELSGRDLEDLIFAKRAIGLIQDGIDLYSFHRYLSTLQAA